MEGRKEGREGVNEERRKEGIEGMVGRKEGKHDTTTLINEKGWNVLMESWWTVSVINPHLRSERRALPDTKH
jgi:hypothetical protein